MYAIRMHETGGPEVLTRDEVPNPTPGAGQVVIRTAAAGVNFIDTYHRRGIYPVPMPFTFGAELAGVVESVGDGVDHLAVGDRVATISGKGAYAELVVADADRVVRIPDGVDTEVAAAVMLQGMTAHMLVNSSYPIGAGERCLIHAGAGGVGLLAIQLAVANGAEVFTTVSTDDKAELAAGAGAHHVIRYDRDDFAAEIRRISGEDRPLAVVYDGVGKSTFEAGLSLIRPLGTMVLYGQSSGVVPPFDLNELNKHGSLYVTRPSLGPHLPDREALVTRTTALFGAIAAGTLDVRIGQRFPLADAADAHRALEGRATTGKVLLIP